MFMYKSKKHELLMDIYCRRYRRRGNNLLRCTQQQRPGEEKDRQDSLISATLNAYDYRGTRVGEAGNTALLGEYKA